MIVRIDPGAQDFVYGYDVIAEVSTRGHSYFGSYAYVVGKTVEEDWGRGHNTQLISLGDCSD